MPSRRKSILIPVTQQMDSCQDCNGKVVRCHHCGKGYCEHGNRKERCIDCGLGYCKHKKRKDQCRDCGTSLCSHGKHKYSCRTCNRRRENRTRRYRKKRSPRVIQTVPPDISEVPNLPQENTDEVLKYYHPEELCQHGFHDNKCQDCVMKSLFDSICDNF